MAMPERKIGMGSVELLVALVSMAIYLAVSMNPSFAGFLSLPSAPALLLQIIVGVVFITLFSGMLEMYGKSTKNERDMHELAHIFRLIAYPVLALVLLHTLDISISSLLVGAGFLGIIVGLAAQTSLGNIFSGLSIMYARPIRVGDKVTLSTSVGMQAPSHPHELTLNGLTGTVKMIGLIYTRIQRDDLTVVYVPNSILNQGLILNHSRNDQRQIRIRLEVRRGIDLDLFKERLISRLSRQKDWYSRLKHLETRISLMSSDDQLGIIITAIVEILDYDRLSQWLAEESISAAEYAKSGRKGSKGKS